MSGITPIEFTATIKSLRQLGIIQQSAFEKLFWSDDYIITTTKSLSKLSTN
jgi:hypothetical protein